MIFPQLPPAPDDSLTTWQGIGERIALAALGGLWAFASGLAGIVLLGAWILTDHVFWYANENLLQTSPLAFLLAPLLAFLLVSPRPPRAAVGMALAVAALSTVGFVLQALPGLDQVNREIIALALPANAGLALALWTLARRSPPGHGPGEGAT
ncbi:MAG: hypothetical protein KY453_10840 [Gemmatimonadetes bacterium]|nr:hypothetical protein [Gemmatimonadota bacterium]